MPRLLRLPAPLNTCRNQLRPPPLPCHAPPLPPQAPTCRQLALQLLLQPGGVVHRLPQLGLGVCEEADAALARGTICVGAGRGRSGWGRQWERLVGNVRWGAGPVCRQG